MILLNSKHTKNEKSLFFLFLTFAALQNILYKEKKSRDWQPNTKSRQMPFALQNFTQLLLFFKNM